MSSFSLAYQPVRPVRGFVEGSYGTGATAAIDRKVSIGAVAVSSMLEWEYREETGVFFGESMKRCLPGGSGRRQ